MVCSSRPIVSLFNVINLVAQYEQTLTQLQLYESQVEELKLQLDDALGAEEMLVGLTEKIYRLLRFVCAYKSR
jgi:hypothetical protein